MRPLKRKKRKGEASILEQRWPIEVVSRQEEHPHP
jgi:hypothetical protein